jgi:hypothetical protein
MRIRLWAALASALTVSVGFITVLGLLIGDNLGALSEVAGELYLREATNVLLEIVTITIALTVLIGILNLVLVHLGRLNRRRSAPYSLVLLISFGLVVVLYAFRPADSLILLETVQLSVESALAALVLFALVYGAYRMMRQRVSWSGSLFVLVVLVMLVGALPFTGIEPLQDARDWLLEIPVSAGARGLLLGIALATLVTGLRVLVGIDRSYRE